MSFSDSKPHYQLLDALRGVASLLVIWYHVFEGFATSPIDQHFNHGYLAVDFFFILSGFVMGYAYDDRWGKMSVGGFFKRRLIRLHPMVILGALFGVITFCIQGAEQWDHTKVATSAIMISLLMAIFLLPAAPGSRPEVRGNGEMFPLNGPSWSLFFEYIGNILYALIIRRLSTKALKVVVAILGASLAAFAIFNGSGFGHLGVGWTMADNNLIGGFLRMSFSYSMGMLLSRNFKPMKIRGAFWKCSLILATVMVIPHIGNENNLWMNGLYDTICVLTIFPLVVYMGASGSTTSSASNKICQFLGDISYPLYIVHYPFMYLFYSWLWNNEGLTTAQIVPVVAILYLGCIALAWLCLKLYDEPVRKYLSKKFIKSSK